MSKSEKTIYEIGYNLIPTISEEEVAKEVGKIKEQINSLGGLVISDEYPNQIKLAYEMTKEIDNKNVRFNSAYFGWIKFEMSPESVSEVKKMADNGDNFLRYIIIKTVRENTIYTPRIAKPSRRVSSDDLAGAQEDSLPMDKEAVDKKIDELIDEEASL
ncbi:MAG: 30S ribosomal protein S6 [Candidatus Paceibacterota bacterium]